MTVPLRALPDVATLEREVGAHGLESTARLYGVGRRRIIAALAEVGVEIVPKAGRPGMGWRTVMWNAVTAKGDDE